MRQQDRAGAGAEDRLAGGELAQRLGQVFDLEQLEHGGAFAAGHDEAVAGVQLLRGADFDGASSGALHGFAVSVKIALEGEDADGFHQVGYQPRVWRSSLSGSLETSRPRMASPSSSLASSSFAGSL